MRCKVTLGSKINLGNNGFNGNGFCLSFYAVYAGSEENDKYFNATPSAQFMVQTVNEQAAAKFEIGKSYYVDFTEV